MNRILEMMSKASLVRDKLEALEDQYNGIKKGSIYNTLKRHAESKLFKYSKDIEEFGLNYYNTWDIRANREDKESIIGYSITLHLEHSINTDEIISRLKLSGYDVVTINLVKTVKMGFPRIKEFS